MWLQTRSGLRMAICHLGGGRQSNANRSPFVAVNPDTHGLFDVRTGKALFNDGIFKGFTSVALNQGILQLGYDRGVNATCSLLSDRTGCWADLLAKGQIPPGAFRGPPSIETCKKGYGSDPVDQRSVDAYVNRSIISYNAALTLDSKVMRRYDPWGLCIVTRNLRV